MMTTEEEELSPEEQEWRHEKVWVQRENIPIPQTGVLMDWSVMLDGAMYARLEDLMRRFQCYLLPLYDQYPEHDPVYLAKWAQQESRKKIINYFLDEHWVPMNKNLQITQGTLGHFIGGWVQNLAENLPVIRSEGDLFELRPVELFGLNEDLNLSMNTLTAGLWGDYGSSLIIGAGPGVEKSLRKLRKLDYQGTIISTDRALKKCLDNKIIPDFVTNVDAKPIVATWFDHLIVKKHMKDITMLSVTTTHPDTQKIWKGDRLWFNGSIDEHTMPNIAHIFYLLTRKNTIECGGNVGTTSWFISRVMAKRRIGMIGMPLGYPVTPKFDIWKTQKAIEFLKCHAGVEIHQDDQGKVIAIDGITDHCLKATLEMFQRIKNPHTNQEWVTDYTFACMISNMVAIVKMNKKIDSSLWMPTTETYNCTEGGGCLFDWNDPRTIPMIDLETFVEMDK